MITVNGKQIQLTSEMSVADYLEQNNYQINRIAVEMNEEILPKYSYSETMLKDGDRLASDHVANPFFVLLPLCTFRLLNLFFAIETSFL